MTCLDCPQPANYAAIALQLQETALQAEQCIYDLQQDLRAAANPTTLILTSTATENIIANTLTPIGQTVALTTNFANSSMVTFFQPPAGVWKVGANINMVATGAVTDGSYRNLYIRVRRFLAPSGVPDIFSTFVTANETNNGIGADITASATVTVATGQSIEFAVQHGNVGSTMNVSIGAVYWATRLSDQVALKVV